MVESPPAHRRLLGAALRRYREDNGYDLGQAAHILDCHRSKMSRVESGERGIRPKELRELLTEYGVAAWEQDALVALSLTHPREDPEGKLPEQFREYLALEKSASDIEIYDPLQIPDLLWNPNRLHQYPWRQPRVTALIGEAALRDPAEAHALLQLTGDHPNFAILVGSMNTPPHTGPATVLRFADRAQIGAVYLPGPNGGIILTNQNDVAGYARALSDLRVLARPLTAATQLPATSCQAPSW